LRRINLEEHQVEGVKLLNGFLEVSADGVEDEKVRDGAAAVLGGTLVEDDLEEW